MSEGSHCQESRRKPTQARGTKKVQALVQATAAVLEETGYEAMTTKAIAARAGSAIGSFYQFFPNKEAAVNELVRSYRDEIRNYLDAAVDLARQNGVTVSWAQDTITGVGELFRNLPGFRGVWGGRFNEGPLNDQATALRQEVFDALNDALADAFPSVAAADRQRCLSTTLETARAIVSNIDPDDPAIAEKYREMQRMLGLYLASYFSND